MLLQQLAANAVTVVLVASVAIAFISILLAECGG